MKINLRVTLNDGSAVDTIATTADLVDFEEQFSRSVARLEVELRLTDICWLAWRSLIRQTKTSMDFKPWLDTIDGVELMDTEPTAPLESASIGA